MQVFNEPNFVKEEARQVREFDYPESLPILKEETNDFIGGTDDDDDE